MSLKTLLAAIATVVLLVPSAQASAVIIQPESIVANTFIPAAGADDVHIIDQSGLAPAGYTSGVTPFDDYVLGPPPTTHASFTLATAFMGAFPAGVDAFIDFQLDDSYELTDFALWNGVSSFGIDAFELLVGGMSVGTFNAAANNPNEGQVFSFSPTEGQSVRLRVLSGFSSNSILLGEVAFGGTLAAPPAMIPEPVSAGLLAMALAGFGFRRLRAR